jgi:hypothetical protein
VGVEGVKGSIANRSDFVKNKCLKTVKWSAKTKQDLYRGIDLGSVNSDGVTNS